MTPNVLTQKSLSIVIASHMRLEPLKRAVAAVRCGLRATHEIIIVGETDGGIADWARRQYDVRFFEETKRLGGAGAFNFGLREATGRFVTWLHDDCRPLPGALDAALKTLKRPDFCDAGCVVFYQSGKRVGRLSDSVTANGRTYGLREIAGIPVPTFGLMRREQLDQLGYFDERYYAAAWEIDLALTIRRRLNLRIVGCREALMDHDELRDERKKTEEGMVQRDMQRLETKWDLSTSLVVPALSATVPTTILPNASATATGPEYAAA